MLCGAIVHPDIKEVIPLAPEAILQQDGCTKNDCELNSIQRFLSHVRLDIKLMLMWSIVQKMV
jgi:hypothetical protein